MSMVSGTNVDMGNKWKTLLKTHEDAAFRYRRSWETKFKRYEVRYINEVPAFFSETDCGVIERIAQSLIAGCVAVYEELLFSDTNYASDAFSLEYIDPRMFESQLLHALDFFLARPDFYLDQGSVKILEQNISTSNGGFSHEWLIEYFLEHPVMRSMRKETGIEAMSFYSGLKEGLQDVGIASGALGVLTLPKYEKRLAEDFNRFHFLKSRDFLIQPPKFVRLGGTVSRFKSLHRVNPKQLTHLLRPIVARNYFVDRALKAEYLKQKGAGLKIVNDLKEAFLSSKFMLAYLHEFAGQLTLLEQSAADDLAKCLPWTVPLADSEVRFDGKKYSLENLLNLKRKRFVLKKADSCSGDHVLLGVQMKSDSWREAVRLAIEEGDFIVQENVAPRNESSYLFFRDRLTKIELESVYGPMMVNGKLSAIMVKQYRKSPLAKGILKTEFENGSIPAFKITN